MVHQVITHADADINPPRPPQHQHPQSIHTVAMHINKHAKCHHMTGQGLWVWLASLYKDYRVREFPCPSPSLLPSLNNTEDKPEREWDQCLDTGECNSVLSAYTMNHSCVFECDCGYRCSLLKALILLTQETE